MPMPQPDDPKAPADTRRQVEPTVEAVRPRFGFLSHPLTSERVASASFTTVIAASGVAFGIVRVGTKSQRTFFWPFPTRADPARARSFPGSTGRVRARVASAFVAAIPLRGAFFFAGAVLLSLAEPPTGAPQADTAISVLLERNPPNCPLAPVGTPAL